MYQNYFFVENNSLKMYLYKLLLLAYVIGVIRAEILSQVSYFNNKNYRI